MSIFSSIGHLFGIGKKGPSMQDRINAGYKPYQDRNTDLYNRVNSQLPGETEWANSTRNSLMGNYQDQYNRAQDPTSNPGYSSFNSFAHGGGVEGLDDLAAWGHNAADTGLFSDEDKANFRARGTSNVPSFFSAIRDQMEHSNTANGGFSPAYTSQMSKLSRDQAHESQAAVRDTEAGLHEAIDKNKFQGANVWGDAERNKLGAREFGASGLAQLGSESSSNALNALRGQSDLYSAVPGFQRYLLDYLGNNVSSGAGITGNSLQAQLTDQQNRRSFWSNLIGNLMGGVTGLAGGLLGGGRKNPSSSGGGGGGYNPPISV